jgi:demethoxyubiquinone hydroxylase (CLK1/Coq7/Cat5 family)
MKQMTPRTDENAFLADNWNKVVSASFSKQLETELNETKAALEREQQDCAALRQMVRELRDALTGHDTMATQYASWQRIAEATLTKANQLLP